MQMPSTCNKLALTLTVGAILSEFAVSSASGQSVRTIGPRHSCQTCVIARYKLASITDSTFKGGALVRGAIVHVNSDGTFLVAAGPRQTELFLGNRNGEIIRRIGRTGDGPGEFRLPQSIGESNAHYIVFDDRLQRVTAFSKKTLEPTTTFQFAVGRTSNPIILPDGSIAVAGRLMTRDGAGYSLHLLQARDRSTRSFGPENGSAPVDEITVLGAARDGGIWTASFNRYRIQKWNRDGRLMATYERRADWFPPRDQNPIREPMKYANLSSLQEDNEGRLWIHITIRNTILTTGIIQRGGNPPERGVAMKLDADPASRESIIEVIDPASATLVASQRFPGWTALPARGGFYLHSSSTSPSGEPVVDVWGFRMTSSRLGDKNRAH